MKKKLLCLFLAVVMMVGCVAVLASCGDDPIDVCDHIDENDDGKCDDCGETLQVNCVHVDEDEDEICDLCGYEMGDEGQVYDYPWDKQTLIFQFTENDNSLELSSGCHRYLAGDSTDTQDIDTNIDKRNARAEKNTKIEVNYVYWPNTENYKWGQCIKEIEAVVTSNTIKDAPDVYCNFIYDIVGSAVKGYFANLKGTSRGVGDLKGLNFFEFTKPGYDEATDNMGYMNEWMNSVTLSKYKTYVLGSDYFTDMIRAFFVIPVGIELLESYGEDITGDWNDDGEFTVDDFYEQVKAGEWTYDLMIDYSDAVYMDDGNGDTSGEWLGDEQLGFAMANGGVAISGLLYTTTVEIISKKFNSDPEVNDYEYSYPSDNIPLGNWSDAVSLLFSSRGVALVDSSSEEFNIDEWGSSHLTAIRKRFSTGNVLFGDIMMVGALEYTEYQEMRDGKGFGVVPVPLYDEDEGWTEEAPYLTQIHNVGRPGAIAKNTTKFVECTAFLNYQSTHSTDILNQYYNYELMYNVAGGATGTVEMLKYVRANVRTSFDKAMEDAIGVFKGKEAEETKVTYLIPMRGSTEDIRTAYGRVLEKKRGYLTELLGWFQDAQD